MCSLPFSITRLLPIETFRQRREKEILYYLNSLYRFFSIDLNCICCLNGRWCYRQEHIVSNNIFSQLLERRNALLEKSALRRAILEDSYRLQQFERDCDETKGWINEKLKFATDDSYLVNILVFLLEFE